MLAAKYKRYLQGIKKERCCSVAMSCLTLCDPMDCSTPGHSILHYLLEFAVIHVHWVGDAIQPSCPLTPTSFAFNLSQRQVFSNEQALHIRWPKYWNFSFSNSPFNEYSGLISFRIDWLDLAVQGTLKSLLQHNSTASILWCSAFFMVQFSPPYMTSGKVIALAIQTFAGKEMSLLLNTLSWFVIAFLPRSNYLLIWWLQSPSTVNTLPSKKQQ